MLVISSRPGCLKRGALFHHKSLPRNGRQRTQETVESPASLALPCPLPDTKNGD